MNYKNLIAMILSVAFLTTSCATNVQRQRDIVIGMSKQEMINQMGSPLGKYGPVPNQAGHSVEVYEYKITSDTMSQRITKGLITGAVMAAGALVGWAAVFIPGGARTGVFWYWFCDDRLNQIKLLNPAAGYEEWSDDKGKSFVCVSNDAPKGSNTDEYGPDALRKKLRQTPTVKKTGDTSSK